MRAFENQDIHITLYTVIIVVYVHHDTLILLKCLWNEILDSLFIVLFRRTHETEEKLTDSFSMSLPVLEILSIQIKHLWHQWLCTANLHIRKSRISLTLLTGITWNVACEYIQIHVIIPCTFYGCHCKPLDLKVHDFQITIVDSLFGIKNF